VTVCYEYVVLRGVTEEAPGAVRRTASGRAEMLHFAPFRWLVPEPTEALLEILRSPDGMLFDVSGKWRIVPLADPAVLKRAADVEAVFAGRECAALTLFDCPVILTSANEAWVHASYFDAFSRAVAPRPSPLAGSGSFPSSSR
jgi:hypothetical protein